MSYSTIDQLTSDQIFNARVRACCVEQAESFKDAADASYQSLAKDQMVGGITYLTFVRIEAASPGIAEKATVEDGIDQSLVPDGDLLSLTQANWPVVAGLYFNEDGTPIEG